MEAQSNVRSEAPDPVCRDCRHYFVTHEPRHPWGCRLFGIMSARPPALAVREATGAPCNGFELKERLRK